MTSNVKLTNPNTLDCFQRYLLVERQAKEFQVMSDQLLILCKDFLQEFIRCADQFNIIEDRLELDVNPIKLSSLKKLFESQVIDILHKNKDSLTENELINWILMFDNNTIPMHIIHQKSYISRKLKKMVIAGELLFVKGADNKGVYSTNQKSK